VTSSLMDAEDTERFKEDFAFGDHDDDIYYLSLPLVQANEMAILRLGFDEGPTRENYESVRNTIVYVLIAYLIVALVATAYFSSTIVRPLKWLQQASRSIASGDYQTKLSADTHLSEIHDLSQDLESMRSKLVGANDRLQHEISDRETAQADRRRMETRLRRAQRLESLGTLVGGVAHEFNNLLQPILLYTDLALEDIPDDSPVAVNMQRVLKLANRAKGLSHQILTFGRHDDDVVFEELAIAPIVQEAVTMIRALLPATIDIRTSIDSDVGTVRCDPAQVQQLIVNLCNNAFQALTRGGGYISVALERAEVSAELSARHPNLKEGQYVVLEIVDTGQGMEPEIANRVFEPFFTTRGVGEGTGLGLSVVHGIVTRHCGEIILESEPGEGTSFRIFMPSANNNGLDGDKKEN
jgi:signal transduction histidine kinase